MEVVDMQLMQLGEVLSDVEAIDWTCDLYLPIDEPWTKVTSCAVLEEEEEELSPQSASYIAQNRLKYTLTIQDVKSIVSNAKLQKKEASIDELFQAFLFYFQNDAFIDFEST
jgi:hypothetical protein